MLLYYVLLGLILIPLNSTSTFDTCSNVFSNLSLGTCPPYDSTIIRCERGQWPISTSCNVHGLSLWRDFEGSVFTSSDYPIPVVRSWRISQKSNFTPACSSIIQNSVFLPIAYDKRAYQSEGSNYYVIHADTLLPLWSAMKKYRAKWGYDPQIFLFAFDVEGNIDLNSSAFKDSRKYWIQSIQLLFDTNAIVPGHMSAIHNHISRMIDFSTYSRVNILDGFVCFANVQLGVPSLDKPSPTIVRQFSRAYREKALYGTSYDVSILSETHKSMEHLLCLNKSKTIGLVIRDGRRRIFNQDEFLGIIETAGQQWCEDRGMSDLCRVVAEGVRFGIRGNVAEDLKQIQHLSVLVGVQGSGMINALYMSSVSVATALYLNDGWPISSGDPLAILGMRGPYMRHINTDKAKVVCDLESDKFCDSGDLVVDAETYGELVKNALDQHERACSAYTGAA